MLFRNICFGSGIRKLSFAYKFLSGGLTVYFASLYRLTHTFIQPYKCTHEPLISNYLTVWNVKITSHVRQANERSRGSVVECLT